MTQSSWNPTARQSAVCGGRSALCIVFALAGLTAPAWGQFGAMSRVSVSTTGVQGNHDSWYGLCSADGRFVTFFSFASTLVLGDTNLQPDAFVFDRASQTTERISVGAGGVQGNETSAPAGISWDGRFVLYGTGATNLVVPDLNGFSGDLILRDRLTGSQQFVSVDSAGVQGNDTSNESAMTPDTRFVVFASWATNLVPNDTNGVIDIFVRDLAHATTTRESLSSTGVEADGHCGFPSISGDGRYVAFGSIAGNLVAGDTNQAPDLFVRDRHTNTTRRVSVTSQGAQAVFGCGHGEIASGGRYATFESGSPDLVPGDTNQANDIFRHDLLSGTTIAISVSPQGHVGNTGSFAPSISADGRFIAFHTQATNLFSPSSGSLDVYVRDVQAGLTRRVSLNAQGQQGNNQDRDPRISSDGRFVCFQSFSNNLIPGDTNFVADTYVQEAPFTNPSSYCPPGESSAGCVPSLSSVGLPSATSSQAFYVRVDGLPRPSVALVFYGMTSPAQIPFNHSWLCVAPPYVRLQPLRTKGVPPNPCGGLILVDFNAWIQSGLDPALSVGAQAWLQVWIADPLSPRGLLSPALALVVEP